MFNRKVKLTLPHVDNKINIDNISNELQKIIFAFKYPDKRYHAKNISLHIGDRLTVKRKELNKLTTIFEPTPYTAIETRGTLIKATEENNNRAVTKNISLCLRTPKDAIFPNITSDE